MIFTAANKSVLACASVFLALAAQSSAHAIPNPALGVKGTPKRGDVQRPSTGSPCGSVNIASTIDSSTATPVAADGTVTIQVQNFNAGGDGSTSVSVQVDQTGTGKKFVAGTVKTNGNAKPTKVESDKVVFSLPAGTKCVGGKAKNLCLVSVKTTAGFGACTVVSQKAAAAAPAAPPKATTAKAVVKTTAKPAATKAVAKASAKPQTKTTVAKGASATPKSNKGTTTKAGAAKSQACPPQKYHKGKKAAGAAKKGGAAKAAGAKKPAASKAAAAPAKAQANKMMKEKRDIEMFSREELEAELERREEVEERDVEFDDEE
ncbi:hypothetical protein C8R46DRAFT_180661 [Mycena filopes]|nr:hypothetical protein C8R46DRAFT_180661 [Mycena filopes]